MDTRLKNNRLIKVILNIVIISTMIAGYYLNIYQHRIERNTTNFYSEGYTIDYFQQVNSILQGVASNLYTEDEANESAYVKKELESVKKAMEDSGEPFNEEEWKNSFIADFKNNNDKLDSDIRYLNDYNENIEYYIEVKNPYDTVSQNIYSKSNVGNVTKDSFVKTTENGEYNYLFLDKERNINKSQYGANACSDEFYEIYNVLEENTPNSITIYIRVPEVLQPGDDLYNLNQYYEDSVQKINNLENVFKMGIGLLVIAIIIRLLLTRLKSEKINVFENIFIEIPFILYVYIFGLEWKIKAITENHYGNGIENQVFVIAFILVSAITILLTIEILKLIYDITIGNKKLKEVKLKSLVVYILKLSIKFYKSSKPVIIKNINKVKATTEVKNAVIRNTWFIVFTLVAFLGSLMAMIPEWWVYNLPWYIFNFIDYIQRYSFIVIIYLVLYFLWLIKSKIKDSYGLNKLKVSTENISKGNYKEEVPIVGTYTVQQICKNVKAIEEGLDKAVDTAVKSEKMKGELITNVSHDLKTPLTSIINYIDLLGKKDITEEDREKYIYVLKGKSERLKILIEDLFEASKAASGNLELFKENIDVVALMRQTLGEFDEKIENSGLNFITKWPEEKLILNLDGRKTFRVFENIISNVLKYSMKNTRVYVEVKRVDDGGEIIVKNISAYELNFNEEEILERFVRGDKSRNTEGSGLGLSIAKSLVQLQGGDFKIDIDGDLFKVIIKFNL